MLFLFMHITMAENWPMSGSGIKKQASNTCMHRALVAADGDYRQPRTRLSYTEHENRVNKGATGASACGTFIMLTGIP